MKMIYPKKVKITELLLRDGLQNEKKTIPTETKLYFAKQFTRIGFSEIEIGSFAHPKYLPQYNDIEKILHDYHKYNLQNKPILKAFTTTVKAVERAVDTYKNGYGPDKIAFVIAASEEHNKINLKRDWKESFADIQKMVDIVRNIGLEIIAEITTTFGCPITKQYIPFENSYNIIDKLLEIGIKEIIPCDSTGEATPKIVYDYYSELRRRYPNQNVHHAHFHNNRGIAAANILAAMQTGVDHIETSIGGIGGQPAFIVDGVPGLGTGKRYTKSAFNGNTSTEDIVVMLEGMGIDTGLDVDLLLETGNILEEILERQLYSYSIKTGKFFKK
jgi:hydroxymethylglutaryl-CoA lyase